ATGGAAGVSDGAPRARSPSRRSPPGEPTARGSSVPRTSPAGDAAPRGWRRGGGWTRSPQRPQSRPAIPAVDGYPPFSDVQRTLYALQEDGDADGLRHVVEGATPEGAHDLVLAGPDHVKGVNLGAALPGRHPSEFPDSATYAQWIDDIAAMGT